MDRAAFSAGAAEVLGYFYDISQIPRQSGNNARISRYLMEFARGLGLPARVDAAGNVVASKPAYPGYESAMPVILAAHYDMVCERAEGSSHDFDGPLELCREGDRIFARGTTLGADDGMGVAAIMAALAGDFPHPPLEAVFTSSEETDMAGARGLDMGLLRGRLLVTLDARALLCCGSGEMEVGVRLPKLECQPRSASRYSLRVSGLRGGHTGANAMDEPGNAIMLLARLLAELEKGVCFELADIAGGNGSASAFAREAACTICFDREEEEKALGVVAAMEGLFKEELKGRSDGVKAALSPLPGTGRCLAGETYRRLMDLLLLMPDGVCSLNHEFPGAMGSSVNCGVIETGAGHIAVKALIRSAFGRDKYRLLDKIGALCRLVGAEWAVNYDLPHWKRNVPGPIMEAAREIYSERPPEISQGTLECGIFQAGKPELAILGLGFPYYYQHSPAEYALVSETALYWGKLKSFLAAMSRFE